MNNEDIILDKLFIRINKEDLLNLDSELNINYTMDDEGNRHVSIALDYSKLLNHSNELINIEAIYTIYSELLSGTDLSSNVALYDIVKRLCYFYVSAHYIKPNTTYNFIKDKDLKFLYRFFKENKYFATTVLTNYYLSRMHNLTQYNLNPPKDIIKKFDCDEKIMFISDYLRYRYEQCIEEMQRHDLDEDDAINLIYLKLIGNKTHFEELDDIQGIKFIAANKRLYTRLIFADVYEDSTNWDLDCGDEDIKQMIGQINYGIDNNSYIIPESKVGLFLVNRFHDLIFNPSLREYNRNNLTIGEQKVLKKVNPIYQLERVMIGYEN